MRPILFLNHKAERCGVYQLGASTAEVLTASEKFRFEYAEVTTLAEAQAAVQQYLPDAMLCNWHPATMPWLCDHAVACFARPVGVMCHDSPYPGIAHAHLHLDPTFPECWEHFRIGRLVPEFTNPTPAVHETPVIGSFGFGFGNKGFARLVERVNHEFDHAVIRFHIPPASYGDPVADSARAIADHCRQLCKSSITLEASHEFLSRPELLAWLSHNTLNCFLYDVMYGRGVSSVIDLALAAGPPIAITQSWMFRHLMPIRDLISVEETSLRSIIDRGDEPLRSFRTQWSPANLIRDYERVAAFLTRQL